jgi:squalene-hopene/tetraprenyl-beta-curcumene cyclase
MEHGLFCMVSMLDQERSLAAYEVARRDLLAQRVPAGHWVGRLASSALSTATAVSALAIADRRGGQVDSDDEARLRRLIVRGLQWLARAQNADGGWGDTDRSHSNIATTMLVRAAFHLTGVPVEHAGLLERAKAYIDGQGGIEGLRRRYGRDKTFAVPILTNCAIAGLVPWSEVAPFPFELACLPQSWYRFLHLPVVSYAIPALVAIGQARFHHLPPWNPIARRVRSACVEKSLDVLTRIQPVSGGFLEATPLTSFVVMSLASIGRCDHEVTQRGVEFLVESARDDGSWPIDTNLATWNTTLSVNALAAGGEDLRDVKCLDWLLACQGQCEHPYTGAAAGGWGWSDLSGSVPDADDTSGALLAISHLASARTGEAAARGVQWLLDLQNSDGGWPTFCRGWGTMPFDRSGSDLTAHALRALAAWKREFAAVPSLTLSPSLSRIACDAREQAAEKEKERLKDKLLGRIESSTQRGLAFLYRAQHADGSWSPLWFGNQDHPQEDSPVYGTARVLLAYRDLDLLASGAAQRGLKWLADHQNTDGGWGGWHTAESAPRSCVEETALAVEALAAAAGDARYRSALEAGVLWLIDAVERNLHSECSPIGFYFAKLWYYERLYPLIFTVAALGQAVRQLLPQARPQPPQELLASASNA